MENENESTYFFSRNDRIRFSLSQTEFDLLVRVTYREAHRLFNLPEGRDPFFDEEAYLLLEINAKLFGIDGKR